MKTLATDVVRSRISHELKKDAEAVLNTLGLTVSEGIRLFLTQVASRGAIPFEISTPNAVTIAAMRDAETRAARFSSSEALFNALDRKGRQPKTRQRTAQVRPDKTVR